MTELNLYKPQLIKICNELHVAKLFVFGSVADGTSTEDSDIDFLLSFLPSLSPENYSDNFFELHYRLKELLNRDVDITTENSLSNPYFIQSVEASKRIIYEA